MRLDHYVPGKIEPVYSAEIHPDRPVIIYRCAAGLLAILSLCLIVHIARSPHKTTAPIVSQTAAPQIESVRGARIVRFKEDDGSDGYLAAKAYCQRYGRIAGFQKWVKEYFGPQHYVILYDSDVAAFDASSMDNQAKITAYIGAETTLLQSYLDVYGLPGVDKYLAAYQ